MRWFRFYDEVLDDPKVRLLPPSLAWFWVLLLCAANRNSTRGRLPALKDVAFALRVGEKRAAEVLASLSSFGLLDEDEAGLFPHGWNVRQREYDLSTNRTRTLRERSANDPDTDTDTEADTEQKQRRKRRAKSAPKVTRTSLGFKVSEDLLALWGRSFSGVDFTAELPAAFVWERSEPKNHRVNLQAFLTNWMKRAHLDAKKRAGPVPEKVRPAMLDEPEVMTPMPPEIRAQFESLVAGKGMP